jgi:hypothetical protein
MTITGGQGPNENIVEVEAFFFCCPCPTQTQEKKGKKNGRIRIVLK